MYKKIKITAIAILAMLPLLSFAQTTVFDKFEDMDDVATVVVNSEAFRLLGKIGGSSAEAKEYATMLQGLNELKVFTTENTGIANSMKNTVTKYLKQQNLTELMRAKDNNGNVKIYVKKGASEDIVEELLMYVDGFNKEDGTPNYVILSLTGNIDLNKISQLTDKYVKQ